MGFLLRNGFDFCVESWNKYHGIVKKFSKFDEIRLPTTFRVFKAWRIDWYEFSTGKNLNFKTFLPVDRKALENQNPVDGEKIWSRYLSRSKSIKDVHLNSFYPFFFILHGVQLPFLWLILTDSYFSVIIGNLFWAVAAGYYWYITFLGYK